MACNCQTRRVCETSPNSNVELIRGTSAKALDFVGEYNADRQYMEGAVVVHGDFVWISTCYIPKGTEPVPYIASGENADQAMWFPIGVRYESFMRLKAEVENG